MHTDRGSPKKFVFCHHPCIDGVASAWAIQEAFPDHEIVLQGLNHNESLNTYNNRNAYPKGTTAELVRSVLCDALVPEEGNLHLMDIDRIAPQDIYFVDYVPNEADIIRDLLNAGHRVTVFDHHHSALDDLEALQREFGETGRFSYAFDPYRSGATITWAQLHRDREPPELLRFIEKMDLLTFDENQPQELWTACYIDNYRQSPSQTENIDDFRALLDEFERRGTEAIALSGKAEYNAFGEWMDETLASRRCVELAGHSVTVIDSGPIDEIPRGVMVSVIQELTKATDDPQTVLFVDKKPGLYSCSVRTTPDVSEHTADIIRDIANSNPSKIGGGGRGAKGQIGQGVLRMDAGLAKELLSVSKAADRALSR